jgi:hypothetical protein
MDFEERVGYLNDLNTAKLVTDIHTAEDTLEKLMQEDASYRNLNARYLAAYNDDCTAVKELDAQLMMSAQDQGSEVYTTLERMTGKKPTAALMENWLVTARKTNEELKSLVDLQYKVAFQCETYKMKIDMAKRRLETLKGVMGLRTAQILFLAPEG